MNVRKIVLAITFLLERILSILILEYLATNLYDRFICTVKSISSFITRELAYIGFAICNRL